MTWMSLERINERGTAFAAAICVFLMIASVCAESDFNISGQILASGFVGRLLSTFRSS